MTVDTRQGLKLLVNMGGCFDTARNEGFAVRETDYALLKIFNYNTGQLVSL